MFFFFVKLGNRVFQQAAVVCETLLCAAKETSGSWVLNETSKLLVRLEESVMEMCLKRASL